MAQLVNKREYPGTAGLLEKEKEKEKEKEREKDKEKEESGKGKEKDKEKDCLQHKLFLDESVNTYHNNGERNWREDVRGRDERVRRRCRDL